MNVNTIDNRTGRRVVAAIGPITGGAGGSPLGDGTEGSGANSSFLKNTPVEINEVEVPIKMHRYGLSSGSGGAGKYRGGVPYRRDYLFTEEEAVLQVRSDRRRFRPYGLYGGYAGRPSKNILNPEKEARLLDSKLTMNLHKGDVLYVPKYVTHSVKVLSPRYSVSFGIENVNERNPRLDT